MASLGKGALMYRQNAPTLAVLRDGCCLTLWTVVDTLRCTSGGVVPPKFVVPPPRDINALGTATKHLDANGKLLTEDAMTLSSLNASWCGSFLPGSIIGFQ